MSLVDKAKADYEAQLKEVNGLRGILMTTMEQFQRACYQLVKKRARYVRLARKAGIEVPSQQMWWEREPQEIVSTNTRTHR